MKPYDYVRIQIPSANLPYAHHQSSHPRATLSYILKHSLRFEFSHRCQSFVTGMNDFSLNPTKRSILMLDDLIFSVRSTPPSKDVSKSSFHPSKSTVSNRMRFEMIWILEGIFPVRAKTFCSQKRLDLRRRRRENQQRRVLLKHSKHLLTTSRNSKFDSFLTASSNC